MPSSAEEEPWVVLCSHRWRERWPYGWMDGGIGSLDPCLSWGRSKQKPLPESEAPASWDMDGPQPAADNACNDMYHIIALDGMAGIGS